MTLEVGNFLSIFLVTTISDLTRDLFVMETALFLLIQVSTDTLLCVSAKFAILLLLTPRGPGQTSYPSLDIFSSLL